MFLTLKVWNADLSSAETYEFGKKVKGGDVGLDILDLDEKGEEKPETREERVEPQVQVQAQVQAKEAQVQSQAKDQSQTQNQVQAQDQAEDRQAKPHAKPQAQPANPKHKKEKAQKPEKPTASLQTLYPEDRVSDFKEKVYLTTGIPPFRQHLFYYDSEGQVRPLYYQIRAEQPVTIDLRADIKLPRIAGVPIRQEVAQERDSLHIAARDHFCSLGQLVEEGLRECHLVDLAHFARGLANLRDSHQLSLIYYGFVILYYPMLNWEAFTLYLQTGDLAQTYPELQPSPAQLTKKYQAESQLIEAVHASSAQILSAPSIKSSVLQSKYNQALVNVKRLLSALETTPEMPLIRARLYANYRSVIFTKMHEAEGETAFEHLKFRLQMPEMPCLLIAIRLTRKGARGTEAPSKARDTKKSGKKPSGSHADHTHPRGEESLRHHYAVLVIRSHGPLQLRTSWSEDDHMTFAELAQLNQQANEYISRINALGREVFTSSYQLPELARHNTFFSSLTLHIFWSQSLSGEQFNVLKSEFQADYPSGISAPVHEEVVPSGSFQFRYLKGMVYEQLLTPSDYAYSPDLDNYEYLTNAKSRARWLATYGQGRVCSLVTRTADTRIEIQDVREPEFEAIRDYLNYRLAATRSSHTTKREESLNTRNLLKLLKVRDPELYNFKQHGSDVVYSRICQKEHQPIPLNESEYKSFTARNKNLKPIKYHNFTSQTPMYYVCPNPQFPHLSFITGQHPKNYCLPCCKKTLLEHAGTKKGVQHKLCLETGQGQNEEVDSGSRYIMNYGKIDINRLGHLPELLLRYLLYNSQKLSDVELRDISKAAYYLYGIPQHLAGLSDVGVIYAISNALEVSPEELLEEFHGYLKRQPGQFGTLLHGTLSEYFKPEEFRQALTDLTRENLSVASLRFPYWNEVAIELLYRTRAIEVIIFEDSKPETSGSSQRSDTVRESMDLILPRTVHRAEEILSPKRKFLLLLRKSKRVKSLFSSNYIYSPVYLVVPQNFFRSGEIAQKIYETEDDMGQLVLQMANETLEQQRHQGDLTLEELRKMLPSGYELGRGYLNRKGQVYLVEVTESAKGGRGTIYLPVPYQYTESLTTLTTLPDRGQAVKLNQLLAFLRKWNLKHPEHAWPLNEWLVHEGKCLGVVSKGYYLYCAKEPMSSATKQAPEIVRETLLRHLPEEINLELTKSGTLPDPGGHREQARKASRRYREYVREFMSQLDSDRNPELRKKLAKVLSTRRGAKARLEDELRELGVSEGDLEKLRASNYQLREEEIYNFDMVRLNEIRQLKTREEVLKYLKRLKPGEEMELLAADFCNPLRREHLLQAIILEDMEAGEGIHRGDHEELFILS